MKTRHPTPGSPQMSGRHLILSLSAILILLPMASFAGEQSLSVGYGFGVFAQNTSLGRVEGDRRYDFFQLAYLYEKPLSQRVSFAVEPFAAYINQPESGVDGGFSLLLRYYPFEGNRTRPFLDIGGGVAYTTIGFKEQGTHLLGILSLGIGVRHKDFFVEGRLRHYSNGGLSRPNRGVHANIVSVGMYF